MLGVIDKMLMIQMSEIQVNFGWSHTVLEHRYKGNFLYSELEGCVSRVTMSFIYEEAKHFKKIGTVKENCDFVIKTLYGLPCACVLAMKIQKKLHIQLDNIDPHWKGYMYVKKKLMMNFLLWWSGMIFNNVSKKSLTK